MLLEQGKHGVAANPVIKTRFLLQRLNQLMFTNTRRVRLQRRPNMFDDLRALYEEIKVVGSVVVNTATSLNVPVAVLTVPQYWSTAFARLR